MDVRNIIKRCIVGILMMNISIIVLAQDISDKTIIIDKTVISDSTISLKCVTNKSGYDIEIITINGDGKKSFVNIRKGESKQFDNIECTIVQANPKGKGAANGSGGTIWNGKNTSAEWGKLPKSKETTNFKKIEKNIEIETEKTQNEKQNVSNTTTAKVVDAETVVDSFIQKLDKDSYWSTSSIDKDVDTIKLHLHILSIINNWTDKEAYINNNNLIDYIKSEGRKIDDFKEKIIDTTRDFISSYGYNIERNFDYEDSIKHILEERISRREMAILKLNETIDSLEEGRGFDITKLDQETLINIGAIVLVILILIICFSIMAKRKKNKRKQINIQQSSTNDASPAIVVRRKTTSILKKQSLEDVIDNKAYLKIECADFCNDSAVRRMYIKNTCIKDIYNMYADDLRNPDNPKEDGCMVLGRWVHDDHTNEYYVSLEEIVRPGDDAVFQEYELNFGGKIKLRVAEKLRKLRRDTNLQYDLTCWVHSHPGLGVFFSNSDTSVQMQLKHPSHPNFLTAIVVDILTPQQELGIFTFKHDSSINSRNDLKKMYSLEELHKWAVESDRNTYKAEDYYNVLSKAEYVSDNCQGIQLNNGTIIDISSITTEENTGLVGWIHGYKTHSRGKNEYVVNTVSNVENNTDNDLLGCLIVGTHCSIPSIRKAITDYSHRIKFVIFYSIKDETITTIPMIDMQLSMDEKYYSEEKLEDLKIWTRRKR